MIFYTMNISIAVLRHHNNSTTLQYNIYFKFTSAILTSTAISAISRWHLTTTLLPSVVMATLMRLSLVSLLTGNASLTESRWVSAAAAAISKPSAMRIGWIPLSRRFEACSRRAPVEKLVQMMKTCFFLCSCRLRGS